MTNFELMHQRLEQRAGLLPPPKAKHTLRELEQSEWSPMFEQLMRNRLIMGALRYGKLRAPGKRSYNRVASMMNRLRLYDETGNLEFLVDVANLCLCEFEESTHPKKHFHALDDKHHVTSK